MPNNSPLLSFKIDHNLADQMEVNIAKNARPAQFEW